MTHLGALVLVSNGRENERVAPPARSVRLLHGVEPRGQSGRSLRRRTLPVSSPFPDSDSQLERTKSRRKRASRAPMIELYSKNTVVLAPRLQRPPGAR